MITTPELKKRIVEILTGVPKGLHVRDLTDKILDSANTDLFNQDQQIDATTILNKVQSILANDVKKKSDNTFKRVINPKTRKAQKGYYKLANKTISGPILNSPITDDIITPTIVSATNPITEAAQKMMNTFQGKAGECAVMSELLFRGFNVNTLLVDDGVDVVASRNNVFYLVQVKTTKLENKDKIAVSIQKSRFTTYIGFQILYVTVVRCNIQGVNTNLFFVFENKDIERFIHNGCIKKPSEDSETISIKIRFDKTTRTPYIYHNDTEENISYFMNNFHI